MTATNDSPCRRHGCHECCISTEMTLTGSDVARLEDAGFVGFARQRSDGDLVLKNRGGRCVFLDDGRCGVYDVRPEGCRLYPLVLNLADDRVELDDLCPHRREFSVDRRLVRRLRRSVATEAVEAARRRGREHA